MTGVLTMMLDEFTQLAIAIAGGSTGLVGAAIYIRRLFKNLGLEDSQRGASDTAALGVSQVIETLRSEVGRLSCAALLASCSNAPGSTPLPRSCRASACFFRASVNVRSG